MCLRIKSACIVAGSSSQTSIRPEGTVEEKHRTVHGLAKHVELMNELELMAGDELGPLHE